MTAAAGNGYALADGEWGVTLFLNHHDGVTVIFTDFQLNALRLFIAPVRPDRYATGNRACSGCKRTTSTAADGITKEATEYRAANRADGIAVIAALDLDRTGMYDDRRSRFAPAWLLRLCKHRRIGHCC
ncbi:hypothetical protein UA44_05765 [Klebsiella aerogenes]|nr:hypothetical protein UA44_05765 [Klebsiella aerogenes]